MFSTKGIFELIRTEHCSNKNNEKLGESSLLLTDSEKCEYKRLLNVTSTHYDPQQLSEIIQNKTILDKEIGVCPTVLEEFRKSIFAKEVIPGCIESCSRESTNFNMLIHMAFERYNMNI